MVRHARRMADSLRAPWTAIHVETGRDLSIERGGARPDRRGAAAGAAARRARPSRCRARTSRTRSPNTRAPTTSPTSSSCSRRGRAGCELFYGLAGAAADPQGRRRQRPCARAQPRGSRTAGSDAAGGCAARGRCQGLSRQPRRSSRWHSASRSLLHQMLGVASVALAFLTAVLVSAVAYGLWPALFACFAQRAGLQLLLPAAALHLHHRRSGKRRRAVLLRRHRGDRQQSDRAGARPGDHGAAARAHHRGAVSVQPQAGGRGEPRRSAVGDGASDRADAEGARRHAAARGRHASRCAPAFRRRTCWTTPTSPRRKWCWEKNHAAGRGPTRCPAPSGCSCRCRPGAARSAWSASIRDEPGPILTPDQQRLLDALADQAALAIERVNLVEDVDRARLVAETDRLRSALLTSISHDLRTPLASILGSATSLPRRTRRSTRRHGST